MQTCDGKFQLKHSGQGLVGHAAFCIFWMPNWSIFKCRAISLSQGVAILAFI